MSDLNLIFQEYGRSPQEFFRIEWSNERPLVWAALLTDVEEKLKYINTDFVMACTPPDHKIYFAAATEYEHDTLKKVLDSNGEFYWEESSLGPETPEPGKSPRSRIRRLLFGKTRIGEKWTYIFSSTRDRRVMNCLFDKYELEYGSFFVFPFIVSKDEPLEWKSHLKKFFLRPPKGEFTSSMLEQSYSVMATYWDHGMELVSHQMAKNQVEEIAREIGGKYSLNLTTNRAC